MAVMLTLVSFIMPPWTLHRHSTRSQHRLSLGSTCFYWLNEGLFVQCSCPPCSCIPAFTESWRRNQACHEGNSLWAFSHNVLCHSVTQISGSCPSPPVPKWWCANCCATLVPLTKHASRLLFSLQTNSIWTIHSDFNGRFKVFFFLVIFLVTVLIYSTGSFW